MIFIMISEHSAYAYCIEDISLIENYEEAIIDTTQTWCCHHRLEIELNKSAVALKKLGLYYHRPASELIFLTKGEHSKLHMPNDVKRPMSEETKKKLSLAMSGDKNPMYGMSGDKNPMYRKHHSDETKRRISLINKGKKKIRVKQHNKRFKWLLPNGEIVIKASQTISRFHPDWIKIGEA